MSERTTSLEVEQLAFRYGELGFRLSIDQLQVEAGARVAVIGPSGSGKTTFLHLAAGILNADAGEIRVIGKPLSRATDAARRALRVSTIGLVFQEFELFDYLSVRENILLPYWIHPALEWSSDVGGRVDALAARTGLTALLDRHPRELSQGERQRVAICRALITQPSLVLADEPTGNLDPTTAGQVLDLLSEEAASRGATLIVVTHDHTVLDRFDRVIDFGEWSTGGAS